MDNAHSMNKEMKHKSAMSVDSPDSFQHQLAAPQVGQVLSILFGLLFLFQCMILPLVGKAAMGGSGSPGAGPAETVWKNQLFFLLVLLLTLAVGSFATYSKWLRHRNDGSPFPKATAGLLALTVALLLAFAAGLLKI
jgi:hypothetical protein